VADPLLREQKRLYGLPATEFTAARNARAKELRRKDPELAAAVAKLPKPTAAAGAVNQLVREDPSEVRALVQSGKRLREAQEHAVTGKRGASLADAIQEHRAALERVQRELRRRKLSGPTLEKAVQSVRVASLDPELQPLLERGTLHEDLAAAGFGLDPGLVPAKRKANAQKPAPPGAAAKKREQRLRAAREQLQAAEAALDEARSRAKAAQRDLERAAADVERAQRAVDAAGSG
jgi:predicted  nucleic acid-binding Zn-ribbon protein